MQTSPKALQWPLLEGITDPSVKGRIRFCCRQKILIQTPRKTLRLPLSKECLHTLHLRGDRVLQQNSQEQKAIPALHVL